MTKKPTIKIKPTYPSAQSLVKTLTIYLAWRLNTVNRLHNIKTEFKILYIIMEGISDFGLMKMKLSTAHLLYCPCIQLSSVFHRFEYDAHEKKIHKRHQHFQKNSAGVENRLLKYKLNIRCTNITMPTSWLPSSSSSSFSYGDGITCSENN